MSSEFKSGFDFDTEYPVGTLDELLAYVMSHVTLPPFTGEYLASLKSVSLDELEEQMTSEELPESTEFTEADAVFLKDVILFVAEDPTNRAEYVVMEPDGENPGSTIVQINFPAHMEPPAELR